VILIYKKYNKKIIHNVLELKKSKIRKKKQKFIIEGFSLIKTVLNNNFIIHELYTYDKKYIKKLKYLHEINTEIIVYILHKSIFKKISYNKHANKKIISIIKSKEQTQLHHLKISQNIFIIILNNIEKPGNIGAIIRTAKAGDVDLIILNNTPTDIFNPNIIRASMGTVFNSKIIINNNIYEIFKWLQFNNIKTLITSPLSGTDIYSVNLYKYKTAIIMGSEHKGVENEWNNYYYKKIKIPMNNTDSLNVSIASAIIIFEYIRQKHQYS
jgi:TrmH family RNA methyltransferase